MVDGNALAQKSDLQTGLVYEIVAKSSNSATFTVRRLASRRMAMLT